MSQIRALLIEDHEDIAHRIIREIDWIDFDWVKDANSAANKLGFEIQRDREHTEAYHTTEIATEQNYKFILSDNYLLGKITAFHLWEILADPMLSGIASERYKANFDAIPIIFPISSAPEMIKIEEIGAYKCGTSIFKHDQKNPLWINQLKEAIKNLN